MKLFLRIFFVLQYLLTACQSPEQTNTTQQGEVDCSEHVLVPVQDFFKNSEKTNFQISPDGEHLAFLAPQGNRMNVFIRKRTDSTTQRVLTASKDRDIQNFYWVNDKCLIYFKEHSALGISSLHAIDIEGKDTKELIGVDAGRSYLVSINPSSPQQVLVGIENQTNNLFDLYALDVHTAKKTLVMANSGQIIEWGIDNAGRVRAYITNDGLTRTLHIKKNNKNEFKSVLKAALNEFISISHFSFDNDSIFLKTNIERDKIALVSFSMENFSDKKIHYESPNADISHVFHSKKSNEIYAVSYFLSKQEYHFFDEKNKKKYNDLIQQIKDQEINFVSIDAQEKYLVIRTFSDRSLGSYYLLDWKEGDLLHLADVSPWLSADQMSPMQPISFTSKDGLLLHGYLTLPACKQKGKPVPLIVNPHGGPWRRDYWGFSPEVQFLANRGYAVLQINFRGSTGYGKSFVEASFKEWGGKVQDDITAATYWALDQGITEKGKIAIMGGSFGGYSALMGLIRENDLYACAVDYVGMNHFPDFLSTFAQKHTAYKQMLYEMIADPVKDSLLVLAYSPYHNLEKIQKPLMIIQGAHDKRVPKEYTDQMVDLLLKKGADVEYMVKYDEGHGFKNEENRIEYYQKLEKFLQKHLTKTANP